VQRGRDAARLDVLGQRRVIRIRYFVSTRPERAPSSGRHERRHSDTKRGQRARGGTARAIVERNDLLMTSGYTVTGSPSRVTSSTGVRTFLVSSSRIPKPMCSCVNT
jgi:hypothetical protein